MLHLTLLAARGESPASHRGGRCAREARREEREYRESLREEQRSPAGCSARRMQLDFHHGLLTAAAVILLAIAHTWRAMPVSAQESRLVGRWRVEYSFSEGATSVLQFDARESGKGSFLSLDTRRSNLAPAIPGEAVWTQTSTRVSFSGEVDIPIGNVGYEMRKLKFEGAFKSPSVISGEVAYISDAPGSRITDPSAKGAFKATRMARWKKPANPPKEG